MLPACASRWSAIALIAAWVVEFPVTARRKSSRRSRQSVPACVHRTVAVRGDIEQQGDLTEVLALPQRPHLLAVHVGIEDSRGDEKHVLGGLALPDNHITVGGLQRDESRGELVCGRHGQRPECRHASDGVKLFALNGRQPFHPRQAPQGIDRPQHRQTDGDPERLAHADRVVELCGAQAGDSRDGDNDQCVDADEQVE